MAVRLRHRTYWARIRIPKELEASDGGKKQLETNLRTSDLNRAKQLATAWEGAIRLEFIEKAGTSDDTSVSLRKLYETARQKAEAGEIAAYVTPPDRPSRPDDEEWTDPVLAGINLELETMADAIGERDLTPIEQARLDALNDASTIYRGGRARAATGDRRSGRCPAERSPPGPDSPPASA